MNELEEFYPYVEMPALQQSPQKFAERYKKGASSYFRNTED